jgi:UDP-GlcNAc:undecaprenyl-phosphate/decaprenyl-phosphate GlcNAc-1-phosphate transferase
MLIYNAVLCFLWAFLISIFAIPSIIDVAHKKKLLDVPNLRTMHKNLTPRLGGLAIFAGFMSSLTIFGELTFGVQHLLAGCIIIFFIGLKDDIVSVSAFKKFFVQILATGIILFVADIRVTNFQGALGLYELEDGISYVFSFILIIGITNAINLVDGLDGLAGTIVLIISSVFGTYFLVSGGPQYIVYGYVAFCLIGAISGFLRYNLYKAKIFMGDTGSLVCGFIVSVLTIQFIEMRAVEGAPVLALSVLIIPTLDTLRVFLLRIYAGVSPFAPDRNHLHHRLIDIGFSQLYSVAFLAFMNLFIIIMVIQLSFLSCTSRLLILIGFSVFVSIIIEILYKNINLKTKDNVQA